MTADTERPTRWGRDPERDGRIDRLAAEHRLLLVWQHPRHEALLLHHLPSCQTLRPFSSAAAKVALEQRWQGYYKGIPAARLRERIGFTQIQLAASVETGLRDLLSLLGFRPALL